MAGESIALLLALLIGVSLDARRAIGTSLGMIAVNSAAGLAGQLRYTHWDWPATCTFLA